MPEDTTTTAKCTRILFEQDHPPGVDEFLYVGRDGVIQDCHRLGVIGNSVHEHPSQLVIETTGGVPRVRHCEPDEALHPCGHLVELVEQKPVLLTLEELEEITWKTEPDRPVSFANVLPLNMHTGPGHVYYDTGEEGLVLWYDPVDDKPYGPINVAVRVGYQEVYLLELPSQGGTPTIRLYGEIANDDQRPDDFVQKLICCRFRVTGRQVSRESRFRLTADCKVDGAEQLPVVEKASPGQSVLGLVMAVHRSDDGLESFRLPKAGFADDGLYQGSMVTLDADGPIQVLLSTELAGLDLSAGSVPEGACQDCISGVTNAISDDTTYRDGNVFFHLRSHETGGGHFVTGAVAVRIGNELFRLSLGRGVAAMNWCATICDA